MKTERDEQHATGQHRAVTQEQDEWDRILGRGAHMGHEGCKFRRSQVVRVVDEESVLEERGEKRPVVHHDHDHGRKVMVEL